MQVPEGQTRIARRFNAGNSVERNISPEDDMRTGRRSLSAGFHLPVMINKKTNKNSGTAVSKCDVIKIGIDVHAGFIVASRQLDGPKPQPAQKFLACGFLPSIPKARPL